MYDRNNSPLGRDDKVAMMRNYEHFFTKPVLALALETDFMPVSWQFTALRAKIAATVIPMTHR